MVAVGNRVARVDSRPRGRWKTLAVEGPVRSLACAGEAKTRTVAVATDFEVVSFDAATGRALWRFSPPGATRLVIRCIRDLLVISTGDGRLYGIRPNDGRLLWRARGRLLETAAAYREWLLAIGRSPGQLTGVSLGTGAVRSFEDLEMTRVAGAVSDRLGPGGERAGGKEWSGRRIVWRWKPLELGP